jgi:hypothetical protein
MSIEDRLSEVSLYCNVHVQYIVLLTAAVLQDKLLTSCCTGWWAMSIWWTGSPKCPQTAIYMYIIELTASVLQDKPTAAAQAGGP